MITDEGKRDPNTWIDRVKGPLCSLRFRYWMFVLQKIEPSRKAAESESLAIVKGESWNRRNVFAKASPALGAMYLSNTATSVSDNCVPA